MTPSIHTYVTLYHIFIISQPAMLPEQTNCIQLHRKSKSWLQALKLPWPRAHSDTITWRMLNMFWCSWCSLRWQSTLQNSKWSPNWILIFSERHRCYLSLESNIIRSDSHKLEAWCFLYSTTFKFEETQCLSYEEGQLSHVPLMTIMPLTWNAQCHTGTCTSDLSFIACLNQLGLISNLPIC